MKNEHNSLIWFFFYTRNIYSVTVSHINAILWKIPLNSFQNELRNIYIESLVHLSTRQSCKQCWNSLFLLWISVPAPLTLSFSQFTEFVLSDLSLCSYSLLNKVWCSSVLYGSPSVWRGRVKFFVCCSGEGCQSLLSKGIKDSAWFY